MTTRILKEVGIPQHRSLDIRRNALLFESKDICKESIDNQLSNWTITRLYYLLISKYEMPESEASELLILIKEKLLSVEDLAAMVDEEIMERLRDGVFTDRMNKYVSLAILDSMLGKHGTKTVKSLQNELKYIREKRTTMTVGSHRKELKRRPTK